MKNIIITILTCAISHGVFAQTIDLSTGKGLAVGTVDPNWICLPNVAFKVSNYHNPWQATPIAGTQANWINSTGVDNAPGTSPIFGPTGIFYLERSFSLTTFGGVLNLNFSATCDDALMSLKIIAPNGTVYPLILPSATAYNLGANVTSATPIISSVGNWKIRAQVNFADSRTGFLLSGNITAPDPCCKNNLSFVTPSLTPPYFAGDGFTYAVEDYNVTIPNDVPITEVRVNVENFELISKYGDCLKCYNSPATLGTMVGLWDLGSGANTMHNTSIYPVNWFNNFDATANEATWQNPNGAMLNTHDQFKLLYIFPPASDIPCCVDSAKICLRVSWTDVNCGRCEVRTCSSVPLMRNVKPGDGRGRLIPPKTIQEVIEQYKPTTKVETSNRLPTNTSDNNQQFIGKLSPFHCSPWKNVVGYYALCTELNNVANCAVPNCEGVNTTKVKMLLTNSSGGYFMYTSSQSISISDQNQLIVAANNWATANLPLGNTVSSIKFSPDIAVGNGVTNSAIDIAVTYRKCTAAQQPSK